MDNGRPSILLLEEENKFCDTSAQHLTVGTAPLITHEGCDAAVTSSTIASSNNLVFTSPPPPPQWDCNRSGPYRGNNHDENFRPEVCCVSPSFRSKERQPPGGSTQPYSSSVSHRHLARPPQRPVLRPSATGSAGTTPKLHAHRARTSGGLVQPSSPPLFPPALQVTVQKTRLCVYLGSGRQCPKAHCSFAHSQSELRQRPDLVRTKLCRAFTESGTCDSGTECRYAHGLAELRHTKEFYKTALCAVWDAHGVCKAGNQCRFAHGVTDLRPSPVTEGYRREKQSEFPPALTNKFPVGARDPPRVPFWAVPAGSTRLVANGLSPVEHQLVVRDSAQALANQQPYSTTSTTAESRSDNLAEDASSPHSKRLIPGAFFNSPPQMAVLQGPVTTASSPGQWPGSQAFVLDPQLVISPTCRPRRPPNSDPHSDRRHRYERVLSQSCPPTVPAANDAGKKPPSTGSVDWLATVCHMKRALPLTREAVWSVQYED